MRAYSVLLKLRHYEKATKLKKNILPVLTNQLYLHSIVASKAVGDFCELFRKAGLYPYQYLFSTLGKRRVCSYFRFTNDNQFDQTTCGGRSFAGNQAPPAQLEGRSLFDQRAEELMTHTGSLRGSFVSYEFNISEVLA